MQIASHSHAGGHPPATRRLRPALFQGLTTPEMRLVRRVFTEDLYDDAEAVPRDPARAPFVGLLLDGCLREDATLPGGERLFALTFPGETLSPLGPRRRRGRLSAIGAVQLLTCDRDGFERIAQEVPRLRLNLLGLVQEHLTEAQRWQILLGRKSASERVASMLHWFHTRQGAPAELHLPVTRTELGQMAGLTMETVSRQVRALEKAGVIDLPLPSRVRVIDPGALHTLSGDAQPQRLH
ncbi:Crp/Fnr family transcriptional regulator [Salipiger sp. HF18]|uniref:Crp/Fnr family transcriptional regulator n=1 Tax=Salipiger sp. HF18 TaxID=2721557 RepID=UPI00142DA72C|nr:Crp/Fnr family transcriptional regulator [Salipiger sp. HF18]NIY94715.1 Crp/Fnr family transcriptional regulator [Salipiger sp. HF18]